MIEFQNEGIIWHLSRERMQEIVSKLESMRLASGPCHHYVDIEAPCDTLILSRDEYPESVEH